MGALLSDLFNEFVAHLQGLADKQCISWIGTRSPLDPTKMTLDPPRKLGSSYTHCGRVPKFSLIDLPEFYYGYLREPLHQLPENRQIQSS
jgi:hypothetical protein